jgi:DNA-binding NarL/FixJ family response regulator
VSAASRIRTMVVDDNPVVRAGLVNLLEAGGMDVVGEAEDGGQAIELADRLRPDIVLLDARMPVVDGVSAARPLSEITRVLMLSYDGRDATIAAAIRAGATGYLIYGAFGVDELIAAVRDTVHGQASPLSPAAARAVVEALHAPAGDPYARPADHACASDLGLSKREYEVMTLIANGRSNTDIAAALFISENTVKNHIGRIFAKLGVQNRGAAIATWFGTHENPIRSRTGSPY